MVLSFAFSILESVFCGMAFSQSTQTDQETFHSSVIPRITAVEYKGHEPGPGMPPEDASDKLPNGYLFVGENLKYKPEETHVKLENPGGDAVFYPRMELYTMFPAMGHLYCFDKIVEDHFSASVLTENEMPKGVTVGKRRYIFPSVPPISRKYYFCGTLKYLYKGHILIGPIERDEKQKESNYTAKIVVTERSSFGIRSRR
jgi:hypothetical protein